MKKTLFCLFMLTMLSISGCAQEGQQRATATVRSSIAAYEIYPTTNMWNFIKLNTRNGKMWLVQYTINDDNNRFTSSLNELPLVSNEQEVDGRFKLYPTQNSYNFILLDQLDGNTWQVQWSFKEEQRFVIPIR